MGLFTGLNRTQILSPQGLHSSSMFKYNRPPMFEFEEGGKIEEPKESETIEPKQVLPSDAASKPDLGPNTANSNKRPRWQDEMEESNKRIKQSEEGNDPKSKPTTKTKEEEENEKIDKENEENKSDDKVTDLPAVDQRNYNRIKDKQIKHIMIVRSPVKKGIVKMLNIMSLGMLDKVTKKLGYDKLWHLAIKIQLMDGGDQRVEKNQNISIKPYVELADTEEFNVPVNKKITVGELFNNALRRLGPKAFYEYDAFNYNCQHFIRNLLSSSGLLQDRAKSFVSQDSAAIAKGIPGYVPIAARKLTQTGAVVDKLIQKFFGIKAMAIGGVIEE
jgi:hypothetical protein